MKQLCSLVFCLVIAAGALAQHPQIPTLQVCNGTKATGGAKVLLTARADALHSGEFTIKISAGCDPSGTGTGYPSGSIDMTFNLSD